MFIAMNRFKIARGGEDEFINIWKNRETYLETVPGFKEFHLLQGPSDEECTMFASHSVWALRPWRLSCASGLRTTPASHSRASPAR